MPEEMAEQLAVNEEQAAGIYRGRTTTPLRLRGRAGVQRFFDGLEMVEPDVVWAPEWLPAVDDPTDFAEDPAECAILTGLGRTIG